MLRLQAELDALPTLDELEKAAAPVRNSASKAEVFEKDMCHFENGQSTYAGITRAD